MLAGIALAGLLVSVVGAGWTLAIDVASYFISAGLLVAIRDDLPALPGAKPRAGSRGDRDANPGEERGRLRFAKAHGFLEVEAYLLPGGTIPFAELRLDR